MTDLSRSTRTRYLADRDGRLPISTRFHPVRTKEDRRRISRNWSGLLERLACFKEISTPFVKRGSGGSHAERLRIIGRARARRKRAERQTGEAEMKKSGKRWNRVSGSSGGERRHTLMYVAGRIGERRKRDRKGRAPPERWRGREGEGGKPRNNWRSGGGRISCCLASAPFKESLAFC